MRARARGVRAAGRTTRAPRRQPENGSRACLTVLEHLEQRQRRDVGGFRRIGQHLLGVAEVHHLTQVHGGARRDGRREAGATTENPRVRRCGAPPQRRTRGAPLAAASCRPGRTVARESRHTALVSRRAMAWRLGACAARTGAARSVEGVGRGAWGLCAQRFRGLVLQRRCAGRVSAAGPARQRVPRGACAACRGLCCSWWRAHPICCRVARPPSRSRVRQLTPNAPTQQ